MSTAGHRRRLDRLEGGSSSTEIKEFFAAVREAGREHSAALALAEVARALAGTEETVRLQRIASSSLDRPEKPAAPAPAPVRSRSKGEAARPGPNDLVTWEEAMRIPWHDGNASVEAPPLPADPGRPRDPWENWGFVGPPSYAGEGDSSDEEET